ncbi:hypothetical protein [Blastococcus sp. SYSU DS0617]
MDYENQRAGQTYNQPIGGQRGGMAWSTRLHWIVFCGAVGAILVALLIAVTINPPEKNISDPGSYPGVEMRNRLCGDPTYVPASPNYCR